MSGRSSTLTGAVKGGRVTWDDPSAWSIAVAEHEGARIAVTVERQRKTRTDRQNRWYWGCIVPVVQHVLTRELLKANPEAAPLTRDEAHDALRRHLLGRELVAGMELTRSTRFLSTQGFSDYCEAARAWCASAGFYVSAPGEPEVMP